MEATSGASMDGVAAWLPVVVGVVGLLVLTFLFATVFRSRDDEGDS